MRETNQQKREALKTKMPAKTKKPVVPYNNFSSSEQKLLVDYCHEAPKKFLEKASLETSKLFKTQDPPDVNALTDLSKEIYDKFLSLKQTDQQFTNKLILWESLNKQIKSELPGYGLFMAGSTLNGFGLQDSDIDLSLIIAEPVEFARETCLEHLEKLINVLKKSDTLDSFETVQAKVPLVKFHDKSYNFKVDVNFNVTSNIQNTYLLYCYSQVDWRVRPLVCVIKKWAKCHDLLDAKYGSLSSYSLVLMVIHFLQVGLVREEQKILPSLQKCLEGKFDSTVKCIDYFDQIEVPFTELYPTNKQCLGELLLQFFQYYEQFEFDKYVISIRNAEKILKSEYDKNLITGRYMYIEEPFNLSNVGETVYKSATFEKIKTTFAKTCLRLKTTGKLSDIMDESLNKEI